MNGQVHHVGVLIQVYLGNGRNLAQTNLVELHGLLELVVLVIVVGQQFDLFDWLLSADGLIHLVLHGPVVSFHLGHGVVQILLRQFALGHLFVPFLQDEGALGIVHFHLAVSRVDDLGNEDVLLWRGEKRIEFVHLSLWLDHQGRLNFFRDWRKHVRLHSCWRMAHNPDNVFVRMSWAELVT